MDADTQLAKRGILSGLAYLLLAVTTIAAAAVVVFVVRLGTPTVTAWLWPSGPAPWEDVQAVYYPDKANLIADVRWRVYSLEECRSWAVKTALASGDSMGPISQRGDKIEYGRIPQFVHGDYECGIGFQYKYGSVDVYRLTVR